MLCCQQNIDNLQQIKQCQTFYYLIDKKKNQQLKQQIKYESEYLNYYSLSVKINLMDKKIMNGSVESLECYVDEFYQQHANHYHQELSNLPRIHSNLFSSNNLRDLTTKDVIDNKKIYVHCGGGDGVDDQDDDCKSIDKKKSRTWLCCKSYKNVQVEDAGENVSFF